MSDPKIGTPVEVRVPNNHHAPGAVNGNIVLGTPNKADISWFGATNGPVNVSHGMVQDDNLSADNTFRIVADEV